MEMKKTLITLVATTFVGVGLSTFITPTSHAASFDKYITSHTWTMTAERNENGFNAKTKVSDKKIITKEILDKKNSIVEGSKWFFSTLKKKDANTYYGKAKYIVYGINNGKYEVNWQDTDSYMLKLKSKKEFWLVPKHDFSKHNSKVSGKYKGAPFVFKLN